MASRNWSTSPRSTVVSSLPVAAANIFGWVNCWYSLIENEKSSGVRSAQAVVTDRRGTP